MKKKILLFISIVLLSLNSFTQPQWKFHIAFEDATGARDTIWLIWDTTATGGTLALGQYDTLLNEGPFAFNYNTFNVFITSENSDSTKTWAYPFYFKTISVEVKAFNYEYPITISWDTSLFNASLLPPSEGSFFIAAFGNDYFFLVNNNPMSQSFNMLLDNSVTAPAFNWGSQSQFPLYIGVSREEETIGISNAKIKTNEISAFPNPCSDIISLKSTVKIKEYYLISNDGKVVRKNFVSDTQQSIIIISITDLEPGLYTLKTNNFKNQINYEKIIIIH